MLGPSLGSECEALVHPHAYQDTLHMMRMLMVLGGPREQGRGTPWGVHNKRRGQHCSPAPLAAARHTKVPPTRQQIERLKGHRLSRRRSMPSTRLQRSSGLLAPAWAPEDSLHGQSPRPCALAAHKSAISERACHSHTRCDHTHVLACHTRDAGEQTCLRNLCASTNSLGKPMGSSNVVRNGIPRSFQPALVCLACIPWPQDRTTWQLSWSRLQAGT